MTDQSVVQDNGDIWAADKRELAQKLSQYYGIDGVRFVNEHHVEKEDGHYYMQDSIVYRDGESEHLIESGVYPLGHPPSGAIGVDSESLPSKEDVEQVVTDL